MNTDLAKAQRLMHWVSQKLYYNTRKNFQRKWSVKRGEVYFVDLGENVGSEENKLRPCVVVQSNSYNFKSPVFTCAIISSSPMTISDIQVEITNKYLYKDENGQEKFLCGAIDLGQIKTIGKERIVSKKICTITKEIDELDMKLLNIFGLSNLIKKRDNKIKSLEGKIEYLKQMNNA